MIQETFRGYQLPPTFTSKLLERIANFKPTPTGPRGQPLTPWSITTALTIALIVGSSLINGIRFQLPYTPDVKESAKIVEIIDAPLLDRALLHTNLHGRGQIALQAILANAQEEQSEAPSNLPPTPNRVTGTHIATLKQDMTEEAAYLTSVAFSPDGKTVASGSGNNLIQLWDVSTQQHITTLTGHTGEVSSVAFSPDGTKLASGAFDYTAKLWDVSTKQYRNIATLPSPNGGTTVAFSPDGTTVAVGAWDDTLRLWDVSTRGIVTLGRHMIPSISSVAFSPDSAIVAVGLFDNKATVQMWHLKTGQSITTLEGHTDNVSSVVFSHDGKTVATGSWDGTVQLWDVSTGRNITTLKGHTGHVTSVAYSPKGKMLASAAEDRVIRLWDVSTGGNITTLEVDTDAVTAIAYSPDGTTLASAMLDGTVWLWTLSELTAPKTQPATDGNGGIK